MGASEKGVGAHGDVVLLLVRVRRRQRPHSRIGRSSCGSCGSCGIASRGLLLICLLLLLLLLLLMMRELRQERSIAMTGCHDVGAGADVGRRVGLVVLLLFGVVIGE